MNVPMYYSKVYKTLCSLLIIGQEAGRFLRILKTGLMVSAIILIILGILISTVSCGVSSDDKRAVKDITFSNNIIKELTSNREYKDKWYGQVTLENGILIAGIVEIAFDEPFYTDQQWPSYRSRIEDFNEEGPGYSWEIDQTGEKSYEFKDYGNNKIYIFDFSKTEHYAKWVEKLLVFVYFIDENCVVIMPLAKGEEL